jgi:hypothetical protein
MKAVVSTIIAGLTLSSQQAVASNTNSFGPITMVYGSQSVAVSFTVTVGARSPVPACAAAQPNRFAIDVTTSQGQAMAALLLTSWSMKKRIWVNGTGTCSIEAGVETVAYFNAED